MSAIQNLSRRDVLKGMALSRFMLGASVAAWSPVQQAAAAPSDFAPNLFVAIAPTGQVTIVISRSEMGTGIRTSLAMILADELDADWNKVRFEPAPVDPAYNHPVFGIQMTGGSTSTWSSFEQFRKAGAAARALLVMAAARQWNVDAASCRTENGTVVHPASNRRASYGSLAEKAAGLKPPAQVPLKDPKDFKFIGKPGRLVP